MKAKLDLLKIFDAIKVDDHVGVRNILSKDHFSDSDEDSLPIKELCGLLIIAAEQNAKKITQEFISYNNIIDNEYLHRYLRVANHIMNQYEEFGHRIIRSDSIH